MLRRMPQRMVLKHATGLDRSLQEADLPNRRIRLLPFIGNGVFDDIGMLLCLGLVQTAP